MRSRYFLYWGGVCIWGVWQYVCRCTCACRGHSRSSGVLLYHSPLQCPESGSLTEQVPAVQATLTSQFLPSNARFTRMYAVSGFWCGFWRFGLNSPGSQRHFLSSLWLLLFQFLQTESHYGVFGCSLTCGIPPSSTSWVLRLQTWATTYC